MTKLTAAAIDALNKTTAVPYFTPNKYPALAVSGIAGIAKISAAVYTAPKYKYPRGPISWTVETTAYRDAAGSAKKLWTRSTASAGSIETPDKRANAAIAAIPPAATTPARELSS